jgi:1-deoxy-D-xylulose-5-phosphate synthase
LADAGLTAQAITRDVVAQVVGSKIPVARPLPDDGPSSPLAAENESKRKK